MTTTERHALEAAELRQIVADLHWMARRYADGRTSYVTGLFNEHTRTLLRLGVPLAPAGDGTLWARDGMGRAYDGLIDEEAAQGEPLSASDVRRDAEIETLRAELAACRQRCAGLAERGAAQSEPLSRHAEKSP